MARLRCRGLPLGGERPTIGVAESIHLHSTVIIPGCSFGASYSRRTRTSARLRLVSRIAPGRYGVGSDLGVLMPGPKQQERSAPTHKPTASLGQTISIMRSCRVCCDFPTKSPPARRRRRLYDSPAARRCDNVLDSQPHCLMTA